ncbi:MAG: AAA family ATPase, partial [Pseudomonadota bacterium]|nr:AAA family ATPase [Pseudomonadota bacterium]
MFIDMVGSLSVIRDKDPEDAREILASALEGMTSAVQAYGGVVTEVQGDGVMAIFGAPAAQDDHAVRACHAALRAHSLLARNQSVSVALRIGMNSGEVVVGSALDDFANVYTATGAVVHIAARVQNAAAARSTVLSEQTAALVDEAMQLQPLGSSSLKGLAEPMNLFRLVGPIGRPQVTGPIPHAFVGRAGPLAFLAEALEQAVRGKGAVCVLAGDAGIGKTALLERFIAAHRQAVTIVRSAAEHHTSVAALQPFAAIVSHLLRIDGSEGAPRESAVASRLAAIGLAGMALEPALLDLLGSDEIRGVRAEAGAPAAHDLTRSAVVEVIVAASRQRALLITIEDFQRTDSATIALI